MNNKSFFSDCYAHRFSQHERFEKNLMWKVLCKNYIQKFVDKNDTVIDLGAGYCEFINNIECKKKIAVDLNRDTKKFAEKEVKVIGVSIFKLPAIYNNSADVVFLSNVLEHLGSKDDVVNLLYRVNKILRKNGKIILLQPNIDLTKEAYWDFIDHKVALNTKSIKEVLEITGFEVSVFIKKFLPFTTKDRHFPMSTFLLSIYLRLPQFLRPLAGETFVVAVKK